MATDLIKGISCSEGLELGEVVVIGTIYSEGEGVSLENLLFVKDPIKMNTPLPKKVCTVSDENRRFNTEWELDFFFIEKEGR